MKKILLFLGLTYFLLAISASGQDRQIVGLLDGNLVTLDKASGQASLLKAINNLPNNANIADLTFHSGLELFFTINGTSNSPALVSISKEGDYQSLAPLTFQGNQIALLEALAYNPADNTLYAAASLNGGVSDNDFYCESIVAVSYTHLTLPTTSRV